MRLRKEAFGLIVQTNVESITENFENIGAVVSSTLTELRALLELPSLALVEEILKLQVFKDLKQHTASTTIQPLQFASTYRKCRRKCRGKLLNC